MKNYERKRDKSTSRKSHRGPAAQKLYDAVRKLDAKPIAWVTVNGARLGLTPVDPVADEPGHYIVRSNRGMALAWVTDYRAWSVRNRLPHAFVRRLQPSDLLARVAVFGGVRA